MTVSGQAALISALAEHRFSDITGTLEADWVDFKKTGYQGEPTNQLRLTAHGKWELCKDVAAFANGNGGCFVIGYEEVPDPTRGVKVAGPFRPINVSHIDIGHYKDVVERGIYPSPIGVEIIWYATGAPSAGALLISVPRSSEGPHVLRRIATDSGDQFEGIGIPVRNTDRTSWYQPERIYHLIRQAERSSIQGTTVSGSPDFPFERADADRNQIMELQQWEGQPIYVLQAIPQGGPRRLEGFYDNVKQLLERPHSLRSSGFSLRSLGGLADVISGSLVVRRAPDAGCWLDPDGLFTVEVLATPDFLGWGMSGVRVNPDSMLVNSTALVEITLEFSRFVTDVLQPLAPNSNWQFRVECLQFANHGVRLAPGPPRAFPSRSANVATDDAWIQDVQVESDATAGRIAFELLANCYALFGLGESVIPYSSERSVDPQAIIDLGG